MPEGAGSRESRRCRCDLGLDYVPKRAHVFRVHASRERRRVSFGVLVGRRAATMVTNAEDGVASAEMMREPRSKKRDGKLGGAESCEMSDEAAAFLSSLSVDSLLGDAGLFHRHNWLRTLNNVLSSEKTLAQMNKALRGIYVVEAMTLRYEGDDKLSVKRLELRPDNDSP